LADEGEDLALGVERADHAATQRRLPGTRLPEESDVGARLAVLLRLVPREAAAALRVLPARDADLVAVVDDGRAEVGELEGLAELDALLVLRDREDALG